MTLYYTLANLCWYRNAGSRASKPLVAQHFVLGGLPDLKGDFGSLLKKLLFLGRTLLLRLWVLGTHVRKRLGCLLQGAGWWKRLARLRLLGKHDRKRLVSRLLCWLVGVNWYVGWRGLPCVGWWRRLGRLGKHVRRLGRLGRHVRRRLGSLARRWLLGWLVGWLVGWMAG